MNKENFTQMNAKLILLNNSELKEFIIKDYFTAGSTANCNLNHPSLSHKHFSIEVIEGQFKLIDQNSKGCHINNTHVLTALLQNGDTISAGDLTLKFQLTSPKADPFLTSKNQQWKKQLAKLPSISKSNFTVSITGDSGTGKELLARKIHELSFRSSGPFISLNCSALSEGLIESELFGHQKGSFTDASADRKGAFESARGGTLFLDEIGDLPLSLQPKLLRALENKEIRAVGSDKVITTDVRIIVATHQNLQSKIVTNKFRSDLFYRLNVIDLKIPKLSDRLEDFDDIFYQLCREYRIGFTYSAISELKKYPWPGNIRELKNVIQRASALYFGQKINDDLLSDLIDPVRFGQLSKVTESANGKSNERKSGSMINKIEKQLIIEKLIEFKGNQKMTAEYLGLPKSTLHDRIKKYQINLNGLK